MSNTKPRRAPRKAPAERSAELAQATRSIALEQGLSAITLRNVARRAGVAPGLVAHYHPSVEMLVAGTFSSIVAAETEEVAALVAGTGTPQQGLSLLLETLLDDRRLDVTAVWVEAWSLGRRNETLASSVREQMDAWQAVIRDLVAAGVASGDFSAPDAESVAWQILGMVDGLNAQALVRWNGVADRHTHLARAVEAIVGAAPSSLLPAAAPGSDR
ncbi:TetR family transcriptional regulator C-terminal domain-containing protein [Arthrobacter sp. NPDC089319]|uniref:TetR/AcrR family transcriptional regulator n=1 Tax=Arthrobacter sp. NPDC089319 TaxID=3155915 RepID=UPI0034445642